LGYVKQAEIVGDDRSSRRRRLGEVKGKSRREM
jgi:hypothetical protein